MEIKWRGRPEGIKKRLICPLLAFSLVLGLVAVTPGLNGKAEAVDFDKKCSVTVAPVDPKNTELASDIANADVVVDLSGGKATVEGNHDSEAIVAAVRNAGFQVG